MTPNPRARLCSLLIGLAACAEGRFAIAADAAPAAPAPAAPAPAAPVRSVPEPPPIDLRPLPLVGDKDGIVYLRDPLDILRLYPQAQVDLDAHGSIGPHVDAVPASEAGVDLAPRLFVRRAR